jgi:hypothetical protein
MLQFLLENDVILKNNDTGNCMTADEAFRFGGEFVVYDNSKDQEDLYRGTNFHEALQYLVGNK